MNRGLLLPGALVLAASLAACSTSAGSTPAQHPLRMAHRVPPTPVPPSLASYASYADPILATSVGEIEGLLQIVKHPSFETLGDFCSQTGGSISNEKTAYRLTYVPAQARSQDRVIQKAYKLTLAATDECAAAADAGSPSTLKVAIADLQRGLGQLKWAQGSVRKWRPKAA